MGNLAIEVSHLTKKYNVGAHPADSLRSLITQVFTSPLQLLKGKKQAAEQLSALDDISLEVKRGEVVGIIGHNGAGKSTLLKLLSRITYPTSGSIRIHGRLASLLEVGTGFHPDLTGRENIFLNGSILGMSREEIRKKFDEIVEFSGVSKFIDTPVKHFSSGMQMRLAFAVAAFLEPEILLVDEVLAVGDLEFQRKCIGRMEELSHENRTVVLVSHNIPTIQRLCNRAYLLEKGKIVAAGDPTSVANTYFKICQRSDKPQDLLRQVPLDEARCVGWEINRGNGIDNHTYVSGQAHTLRFHIVSNKVIEKAYFWIQLWTEDGYLVWSTCSLDVNGEYYPISQGEHFVEAQMPSLPLGPGRYLLQFTLSEKLVGTVDNWYAEPKLTVTAPISSQLSRELKGILKVEPHFSLQSPIATA